MLELNQLYKLDCMEGMKQLPDGYFELAIVDPPYFRGPNERRYYGNKINKLNIPKKIKIGGKTYSVEQTDKFRMGAANVSAEVDYMNLVIRIGPYAEQKKEADFLHEVIHTIYDFLGYNNHDEKHIDELAQALYMVIQDNPKIFEKTMEK